MGSVLCFPLRAGRDGSVACSVWAGHWPEPGSNHLDGEAVTLSSLIVPVALTVGAGFWLLKQRPEQRN